MARGRKNTETLKRIKESGAEINPSGIYYASKDDRAYVKDKEGKPVYISASKAGDHKVMFYAAAGIRNYISRTGKRPDKKARNQILNRAINAEKTKEIWKKRYRKKTKHHLAKPFKEPPELKPREEGITITTNAPKLTDIGKPQDETFQKIIKEALDKGIVNPRSAAIKKKKGKHSAEEKIKELGLTLDPRYFTYYNTKKGSKLLVRITTSNGQQKVELFEKDFSNEKEMFMEANRIRKYILTTGKLPANKSNKPDLKINEKQESAVETKSLTNDEQRVKSTKRGFFETIKMWIFG